MNRADATDQIKRLLPNYLESQGINIGKNFHCLSGNHTDNKPSMSYKASGSSGYPFVHCFSCGATYDTISLIAKEYGLTQYSRENFEKAYELFGYDVGDFEHSSEPSVPINRVKQEKIIIQPAELNEFDFTEQIEAAHATMLNNVEARRHFATRHYSAEVVKNYKLGFIEGGHNQLLTGLPEHICKSKKANLYQYVYPILNENDKATYFMTEINDRSKIDDYNPKYRKINELPAPLFNERYLKANTPRVIFVVEGIPDALSVESVRGKAIALTGVGYTRLLELISWYKPDTTFVLALDNDPAGKKMTEKLSEELNKIGCRFIVGGPTFKKDFNEELIADVNRFAKELKKTIVVALTAPAPVRKEKKIMASKGKLTFRQVKTAESGTDTTSQAPRFKDKTKQKLVDMYLDSLKKDEIPWHKGWKSLGSQRNLASGRKYRGKNALLLSIICEEMGYNDNRWMTFNEITKYREKHNITGGYFTAPAKGTGIPISYYGVTVKQHDGKWDKPITFEEFRRRIAAKECDAEPDTYRVVVLGTWMVFNCSIINGVEPPQKEHAPLEPLEAITAIINSLGVKYEEHGSKAYYSPIKDTVVLPPSDMFKNEQSYYATQLHELSHSTGHESRMNRDLKNMFGTQAYALEELNAEIASSFLCADLKIEEVEHEFEDTPENVMNHAAYVQSWIQVLENNPEKLFTAINTAQAIEEYILKSANIDLDKLNEQNKDVEDDIEEESDVAL